MKALFNTIFFSLLFIGCKKADNTSVINNAENTAVVNYKDYNCEIPPVITDYFRVNKDDWELVRIDELGVQQEILSQLKNCPLSLEGDFDGNGEKDIAIMARSKKIRYNEVKDHNYPFLLVFNNYENSKNLQPLMILKGENYNDEIQTVIYDQYNDGIWSYLSKENICGKETIVVNIPESSSFCIIWDKNKNTYEYVNSLDLDCNKNNTSKKSDSSELKKTDEFNFSVSVLEKDQDHRPSSLKIEVIKNSKSSQNIIYKPGTWPVIKGSFTLNRINYFTKDAVINEGVETFHDFITADFNFDGREDFAILYDFGGNGGPSYSYFFQNEKGEFLLNQEFPLNEGPFPKIINKADRTLVIKRPKGCCKTNTTTFQLQNKNWKMISTVDEAME